MRFGYNILFVLFFWLSAPYYFWKMWRRGNWRTGFGQRFARYSPELKAELARCPVIWFHAVSVGEVGVCAQLIRAIEPRLPGFQLLVSTTTTTGMAEAARLLPPHVLRVYYPADFSGAVRRAFDAARPRAVVLMETELWPNFIYTALDRRCPLFLVNARFSKTSLRNYRLARFYLRPVLNAFAAVGCQQADDVPRVIGLGFRAGAVHATGNLKFDAALPGARAGLDVPGLLRQIGVPPGAPLLVAGSTHAGEEAILAGLLTRLRQRFPDLFLILVPRHFERTREVARELESRKVKYILRTDITKETSLPGGRLECLLVNSTGELKFFYEQAGVVFIGKSLAAHGGQNPIEPAALGKPVIFGPNMENFAFATRAFLRAGAALQAPDAAGLESAIAELLQNPQRRAELGQKARQVVEQNLGATERTVKIILEGLGLSPS